MTGNERLLIKFLEGSDKRFVIPVYQRNYDWKTENCRRLYDDLVKVVKKRRKSHFFGSIVSVYNPDGCNEEFLIIDGQQRITTVSLLILAMYNLLCQKRVSSKKENLAEQIYKKYLVDEYQTKETRIKLKPVKNDQKALEKLFDEPEEYIGTSNLTVNYHYFYERIQKEEISVDELFDAICRLQIIEIKLNQDDNPQLIFESLNSTGLALSEGDKVRNFILMGLPAEKQRDFYERYWNKIEELTAYNIDPFIRDYLSVKQQTTPILSRIYLTFKRFVEEGNIETEELLRDMLGYARLYAILLTGDVENKRLSACIFRLNRLETTVTRPFFLEVLRLHHDGTLSDKDTLQIFLITESYLFRRTISDVPTNALNKIFLLLHREITGYDGTTDGYLKKFVYALSVMRDRARFPSDAEFSAAFSEKQVYLMNSKNRTYLMERLENAGTTETKDVYRRIDDGDYTIEHIMPQHLTLAWMNSLGEDFAKIHETWLHRAANLTLTAYNSRYSNSTFMEKRDMKNGFRESGFRMNQWISQKEGWGLSELLERSDLLVKRALEIWAYPTTDFIPEAKTFDVCTLDDDADLTGRSITRYSYKGAEQPVTSWVEMYGAVLRLLHREDKSVLTSLAYDSDGEKDLSVYFSNDREKLRRPTEIDEGIYAEGHVSNDAKSYILKNLFKLYNVEPTDLVFYLSTEDEFEATAVESPRHELRKRYWTYALPEIKNATGGIFKNVNPGRENWINGFFGIGGFYLACIANYYEARVDLVFAKTDENENKRAFDAMIAHRAEIEKTLGLSLSWDRGVDKKSAKIFYSMADVSIDREVDWPVMARFHAKWTKRMCDAIVTPYILPMYGL